MSRFTVTCHDARSHECQTVFLSRGLIYWNNSATEIQKAIWRTRVITCTAHSTVTGLPTSRSKQWTPHNAIILITYPAINGFWSAHGDEYEEFGTVIGVVSPYGLADRYSMFLSSPYWGPQLPLDAPAEGLICGKAAAFAVAKKETPCILTIQSNFPLHLKDM
jgi:hypothetical protein